MISYNDFYTLEEHSNLCNDWYLPSSKLAEAAAIMNVPVDQEDEWCEEKRIKGFGEDECFYIVKGSFPCITCSAHGSGCKNPSLTCYQTK